MGGKSVSASLPRQERRARVVPFLWLAAEENENRLPSAQRVEFERGGVLAGIGYD